MVHPTLNSEILIQTGISDGLQYILTDALIYFPSNTDDGISFYDSPSPHIPPRGQSLPPALPTPLTNHSSLTSLSLPSFFTSSPRCPSFNPDSQHCLQAFVRLCDSHIICSKQTAIGQWSDSSRSSPSDISPIISNYLPRLCTLSLMVFTHGREMHPTLGGVRGQDQVVPFGKSKITTPQKW